jgi:hypothetical protein
VKFDNNLHADTWTKYPLLDFSAVGMMRDQTAYLLFLFGIYMVARDRIELPTRGFSDPGGFLWPLYFQQLTHAGPTLSCHKWT